MGPQNVKILKPQGPKIWGPYFHMTPVRDKKIGPGGSKLAVKIDKNGPYTCAAFMSIVEAQRATGDISKV